MTRLPLLSRLRQVFAPPRVRAASSREAYRWGRIDRRTEHFQPAGRSGDAAIYESQELMNRRVRNEIINNAQAKRIIEALTDLTIGTGIQTFASPFDPWMDITQLDLSQLDDGLRFALEADDLFDEWFLEPDQFDAAGKLSGPDMQRLAYSECASVGDALILRCQRNDPGRIVPLCYQILEREQLDPSRDRAATATDNKIVNGVEVDKSGREVAFWLFDAHPHDAFAPFSATTTSRRIPASRVIHLYLFRRPSQSVGATWLDAIGQASFDRDKFIHSEIQSAAKAALLALIAKREHPHLGTLGLETDDDGTDQYGNEEVRLGSSPIAIEIGKDEEVDMVESKRPTNTANNFIDILDHDIAGGGGISFYTLTGRFEKSNYTGFRGALLVEDSHIKPLQNWFASRTALPIRRAFNAMAAASGLYKNVSAAEFLQDQRRYQRFDAIGAGRQLLDPQVETEAAAARLRTGMTTLKLECARLGLHWVKVLRQLAIEGRFATALGVTLDFSKGEGGKVAQSDKQTAEKEEEDANASD